MSYWTFERLCTRDADDNKAVIQILVVLLFYSLEECIIEKRCLLVYPLLGCGGGGAACVCKYLKRGE